MARQFRGLLLLQRTQLDSSRDLRLPLAPWLLCPSGTHKLTGTHIKATHTKINPRKLTKSHTSVRRAVNKHLGGGITLQWVQRLYLYASLLQSHPQQACAARTPVTSCPGLECHNLMDQALESILLHMGVSTGMGFSTLLYRHLELSNT